MKLHNLFSLTLMFSVLIGTAHANAASLKSWGAMESNENISDTLENRFDRLTRGINLAHWFSQNSYIDPNYVTDKDWQTISSLGFKHVRLTIDPDILFDETNPTNLNEKYLGYIDDALDALETRDLSAIINIHAKGEFNQRLAKDDGFVNSFVQFWKSFAAHLNHRSAEQVFLESLNEPAFGFHLQDSPDVDPIQRWNEVQTKLLVAIREAAPNHTLIAKAFDWESVDGLKTLTPVEDPNVVYNFHFYEPMPFTHQGANWINDEFTDLYDLPYPYNQQKCEEVIPRILDEKAKTIAESYCNEKWDAAKLEARIAKAATWAKENNVLLTANEFGVYRSFVAREDRLNWIRDVRVLLEKYDIGWAMWEYSSGFGLAKDENGDGVRVVYDDMADALGMSRRKIPEPSAIAGFALLTLVGIPRRRK